MPADKWNETCSAVIRMLFMDDARATHRLAIDISGQSAFFV